MWKMTFREMLNEIINTNPNDAQQFADDFIMEKRQHQEYVFRI